MPNLSIYLILKQVVKYVVLTIRFAKATFFIFIAYKLVTSVKFLAGTNFYIRYLDSSMLDICLLNIFNLLLHISGREPSARKKYLIEPCKLCRNYVSIAQLNTY